MGDGIEIRELLGVRVQRRRSGYLSTTSSCTALPLGAHTSTASLTNPHKLRAVAGQRDYHLAVMLRRFSPYRGRRLRWDEALFERMAMTRVASYLGQRVGPRFDKAVIPRTNGRLSTMGLNKIGIVTTVGAKSGRLRRQPLALINDGRGLLAIGSNFGREKHPGWSSNLLAHPDCTVELSGPPVRHRAELLAGAERDAAWATANDFYAGYENYRRNCAPRQIRIFRLQPSTDDRRAEASRSEV
ncbi:nitroreductase family deazaflavin-dependent oxidoreductase [Mycolicibacterium anyangense]|nr:nitroreductase family deazaflavin-dependent oxidoreductase [Mycolicibacterium anyangense]